MTTDATGLGAIARVTRPFDQADGLLSRLEAAVEPFLRRYDVGVDPRSVRDYMRRARVYLEALGAEIREAARDSPNPDGSDPLRYVHRDRITTRIVGSALITAGYEHRMDPSKRMDAYRCQALLEAIQDVLDDVLDDGGYTFEQARNLFQLCSERETGRAVDDADVTAALVRALRPEHRAAAPILAALSICLAKRLRASARSPDLEAEMAREFDAIADAQSATVFLRRESFDLHAMREHVGHLWSPDAGADWSDRIAGHSAWVGYLSLIDLCFVRVPPSRAELDAHRAAWHDMNLAMSFFDHVAGIEKDFDDGVLNFAAALVAEAHGLENPAALSWNRSELEAIIRRASRGAARGIACAGEHLDHEAGFYPMLAAVSAVVLAPQGKGGVTWCLPMFLEGLGRSARRDSTRDQEVITTGETGLSRFPTPLDIHSTGLLAGRTAFS